MKQASWAARAEQMVPQWNPWADLAVNEMEPCVFSGMHGK
jgi:hypothetical protein